MNRNFRLVYNNELVAPGAIADGALISLEGMTGSKYATDEIFNEISTSGSYLPRLQLFGGNSDAVKEGKIPMAHYGLVRSKDQIEDLSGTCHILPICWRSKAMRLTEGNVVSVFNPQHSDFKQIMMDSEEKDSKCLFGPEYLVWLFKERTFATFLMGSKTARREARHLKPLLGRAATLKVKLVSNKNYKWHSPVITPCTSPFPQDSMPAIDKVREEADKFNNPEETVVESEESEEAAVDRVR